MFDQRPIFQLCVVTSERASAFASSDCGATLDNRGCFRRNLAENDGTRTRGLLRDRQAF